MRKYAENMQNYALTTGPRNIDPKENYAKYAKDMKKYAKLVSMKFICKICRNLHPPLS